MSIRLPDSNNEEWAATPFQPPPPPQSKADAFPHVKSPKKKGLKKALSSLKVSDDRALLLLSPPKSKINRGGSAAMSGGGSSSSKLKKKDKDKENLIVQQHQQSVNMSLFDDSRSEYGDVLTASSAVRNADSLRLDSREGLVISSPGKTKMKKSKKMGLSSPQAMTPRQPSAGNSEIQQPVREITEFENLNTIQQLSAESNLKRNTFLTPPRQPPSIMVSPEPSSKQRRNVMNMGGIPIDAITPTKAAVEHDYVLRSSELDPYPHQIQIPNADQFLFHAKLCETMDKYSQLVASDPQDAFSLEQAFVGLTNFELRMMYQRKVMTRVSPTNAASDAAANLNVNTAFPGLAANDSPTAMQSQTPMSYSFPLQQQSDIDRIDLDVLAALLQCAEDVVVEGRFQARDVEVTVFSSQSKRQFVACYHRANMKKMDTSAMTNLQCSHAPPDMMIQQSVHEQYFADGQEGEVFALLNRLLERDPFCDVVMCGHVLGGALACVSSMRFAAMYPMMTVSCQTFGTPRIGNLPFRHFANSMPNLKVMRLEYHATNESIQLDPMSKLQHAGHSICIVADDEVNAEITASATTTKVNLTNRGPSGATAVVTVGSQPLKALAYRFDDKRPIKPSSSWSAAKLIGATSSSKKEKKDEISSYTTALKLFAADVYSSNYSWATRFVGEEGRGINGLNNEARCVV